MAAIRLLIKLIKLKLSAIHCTIHTNNVPAGSEGFIVVEARQNTVSNLFYDQLMISFTFLAPPENPVGVALHVFHIGFGSIELFIGERNRKAGFNALCIHSAVRFTIDVPTES
jgi:hypothetical protein